MNIYVEKLPFILQRLKESLYQNAFYLWLVNIFPGVVGVVFWGIASRLYTTEDIGLGSAVLSMVALLAGFAGMGTFTGLIRFLPDATEPVNFINALYTLVACTSLLIGVVFLFGIQLWTPELNILSPRILYSVIFVGFLIVTSLRTLVMNTFTARRLSQYSLLLVVVSDAARLALILMFVRQGAKGIVSAVAFAFFLALIVMLLVFLPRVVPGYRLRWKWDLMVYKRVVPYSLGSYLSLLTQQSAQTFLPIMILEVLGSQANGYAYIPLMLSFATTSIGFSLADSAFAEGSNKISKSKQIVSHSTMVGVGISIFIALIAFIGAPWIMGLFGKAYAEESTSLFRLAVITGPFMVWNQNYFTRLRLEQKVHHLVALSLFSLVLILGIAYLLMPFVGIQASGLGLLVGNIIMTILSLIVTNNTFY